MQIDEDRTPMGGRAPGDGDEDRLAAKNLTGPQGVLSEIGVTRKDIFFDVGRGDVFFMLPTARRVGASGVVYMVDIHWETMRRLRDEAVRVGMTSLIGMTRRDENTVFSKVCAHVVFGIDLHHFQDPSKVLRNAQRMLKLGGSVADHDWKKVPMALDLPLRIWFSEDDATRFIAEPGFTVKTVKAIGRYH